MLVISCLVFNIVDLVKYSINHCVSNNSLLFHFLTEVKYSAREVLVVSSTLSFRDCLYSRITHMIFRTDHRRPNSVYSFI